MTRAYTKTKNFLLYTVVFGAALSVSSFVANMLTARSASQGRVVTSPIPFTPVASAEIPTGTPTDSVTGGDSGSGDSGSGSGDSGSGAGADGCGAGAGDCDSG